MTYFLIFLAVIVAAAVALYVVGLNKPNPESAVYGDALEAPVASLPPVLLPDAPVAADVDRLRFSLGLRGYRMDQVDEVLDRLRDEITAKDLRIAVLEGTVTTTATATVAADAVSPAAAVPSAAAAPSAAADLTEDGVAAWGEAEPVHTGAAVGLGVPAGPGSTSGVDHQDAPDVIQPDARDNG